MPMGRPTEKIRTLLGEKIAQAREEKGLSQIELARKMGLTQRVISYWEREPVALKPDQMTALADALEVSADFLLGREDDTVRKLNGPTGKLRQAFESVAKLPRRQQDKIIAVLEPFIREQSQAS